jgi:DNA-binding MarR family transcriptional regulator
MAPEPKLHFDPIEEARQQWLDHQWAAADAMAAVTSIMRVQQVILSRIDATLRPFDLTFARYEALTLLYLTRRGALPLGKMGVRLMVHPTSVTNTIDRLEEQGLVKRTPHPEDRRLTLAAITTKGRRLVTRATEALGSMRFGIEPLRNREARDITHTLRAIRVQAGDFDGSDEKPKSSKS